MTLAKTVRHRVHSIASRGCVHWSTLPSSQSVLLSLSCGIFALSVLLMGRTSFNYENLVGGAVFILQFALHLGYPDVENPHPLQPYSQSHVYSSDTDSSS